MTICVAAIGREKDQECIVFATDHMISLTQLGKQYEHSIEKYKKINSNTVAMLAGQPVIFRDALLGLDILTDFDAIKQKIHKNMQTVKEERVNKLIFERFKIDYGYMKKILEQPGYNATIDEILRLLKTFNLETSILLVGFKNGEAQITEINELGFVDTRDINFNAIGSGGTEAITTLLFQKHSKIDGLATTLYNVYKAKRNSEVSVGVGKETDLFVLFKNGTLHQINNTQIGMLAKVYEDEIKFGKNDARVKDIAEKLQV